MFFASEGLIRRYLPLQYLLPVLLLLVSSFGCLLALLLHTTAEQNRTQRAREIQMVRGAFENVGELVLRDLQDYAKWDEAVLHLTRNFDADWADDNVSSYLGIVQEYDHVYLLDEQDRSIYAFLDGRRVKDAPQDARAALGADFVEAIRRVRRMDPAGAPILSGFSRADGRIYAYAVGQVVPLTGKIAAPAGPARLLAIAMEMDPQRLAQMPMVHYGQHLQLMMGPAGAGGDASVVLSGQDGRPVARVVWTAARPGTALRRQLLPGSILIALLALGAAGAIMNRARLGVKTLHESKARATYHADHDTLTGLPNRRVMLRTLAAGLARGEEMALIYMDLDGFKEVNDVYGHPVGDAVLQQAAVRIGDAANGPELVARAGGDEFAVVMASPTEAALEAVLERLLALFAQPFQVGGHNITVGISIGCATSAEGISEDELVRRADVAMYAAKGRGKHRWCAYEPSMDAEHDQRRRLEAGLRRAIAQGDISVAFQPVVDARTDEIVCVEALARWSHPHFGQVPPDVFIPVAEKSGLINELGRHVLKVACTTAREWDVCLAVNLSPAQFWDRNVGKIIQQVLAETGFPPHRLELEITEGYLLRRPEAAQDILDDLKRQGVRIALDDFGTGFASIGYLQHLSLDRIKVHRSFISASVENMRAAEMVRAIVVLASALDLPVTAEGIETPEQAGLMRVVGCSRLQGWLFGRALPASEIEELLAASAPSADERPGLARRSSNL